MYRVRRRISGSWPVISMLCVYVYSFVVRISLSMWYTDVVFAFPVVISHVSPIDRGLPTQQVSERFCIYLSTPVVMLQGGVSSVRL